MIRDYFDSLTKVAEPPESCFYPFEPEVYEVHIKVIRLKRGFGYYGGLYATLEPTRMAGSAWWWRAAYEDNL